jgi:repressor LexA
MTEPCPTWQPASLHPRQQAILDFLRGYIAENDWPPTFRQIGAACGVSSTSMVAYHLRRLEQQGRIVMGQGARTIRVIRSLDRG